MKYAIYDKAADGYLTRMEFDTGDADNQMLTSTGYTEYITEARLLDTPKEAADAIVRIESCKFMDKGRFVMHSFNDTLKDQYIISEAGEPTKVVDNITVDLEGNINVKYGTMVSHWSTAFLEYAINRMNALQKAKSLKYATWCNTFDIYKVLTVIDERSYTHYQFIKVTEKGLTEYAKNDVDYETIKNRLEACEVVLDSTHDLLTKTTEERDKAIDYYINNDVKSTTEIQKFTSIRDSLAEVIYAIQNAIHHNNSDAFCCIENRMKNDPDFNSDPFMAGVRENIKDICRSEKLHIANNDLLSSEIARLAKEKDKALKRAEFYKRQANSVYGMVIPGRCNGKPMFCDITTGKKILVDKKKYDDLMECVNNISLTYEIMKLTPFSMDRPSWLSGVINRIENLTK